MIARAWKPAAYALYLFAVLEICARVFFWTRIGAGYLAGLEYDPACRRTWVRSHSDQKFVFDYAFDVYDPHRGWALKPNLRNMAVFDGKTLNSNSKGLRGVREYDDLKPPREKRILVLGDSFTFGEGVSDSETYSSRLQEMLPGWEVINFGVHGYGHDQMLVYLKEEGLKYAPDYVLLGFLPFDMNRNLMEFRDYSKPRFVPSNGGLALRNSPVPEPGYFLRTEFARPALLDLARILYEEYRERSGLRQLERLRTTTALLDEMIHEIRRARAIPIFIYLPHRGEELDPAPGPQGGEKYLSRYCADRGVAYGSLRGYFSAHAAHGLKAAGHWDAEEHLLAARAIRAYLADAGIAPRALNR